MGRKTSTRVTPAHWLRMTEVGSWEGGGTFDMNLKLIVHVGCPTIISSCSKAGRSHLGLTGCRYRSALRRLTLAWVREVEVLVSASSLSSHIPDSHSTTWGLFSSLIRGLGTQKVSFP